MQKLFVVTVEIYLLTGELSALEEISKLCGDKIVKVGKDKKEETRPLITVTELQRFKPGEILIIKHRLPPLKTKIPGFWELDFGYGKGNSDVKKLPLPTHEPKPLKLFDIREFVKKQKEEKRNELFNSPQNPFDTNNPFANTNPFTNANPFSQPNMSSPNPFAVPQSPVEPTKPTEPELNIDDLVKKIDAKIAELEAEEKDDNEAKDNEKEASEEPMVDTADNDLSAVNENAGKIDFSSYNKPQGHDLFDDYLEDLTDDDDSDDAKEKIEESKPVVEETPKVETNKEVYKNVDEINKIMNKKDKPDDDDMFDDFFE